MREYPKGGLIGKSIRLWRRVQEMRISVHAAGACYFLVLSLFPALLLLLSLLRYTPLEVERLTEILQGILPEALLEGAEELILLTYDKSSGTMVGLSAVTALWSAGRGIYGVLMGLNAVYGVEEDRGYLRIRLLSMGYTLVFLVVLVVTLGLHVFGTGLLAFLQQTAHPAVGILTELVNFRLLLLLALQTGFFTTLFRALPNHRTGMRESLPGAVLASIGWLLFSKLYSVYVEHFAHLSNVYGSVYAVALSMLWLYCCVSIVFYGGAVNVLVEGKK